MSAVYSAQGISFSYPADWELAEQVDGRDLVVSASSPDTSFWMLSLLAGRPDPKRVLEEALDAFREEYAELDVYPMPVRLGEIDCLACDLQFLQFEMVNSAFLRAFRLGDKTALILYQGTDRELEDTGPLLEAISESLTWEPESPGPIGY